MDPPNPPDSPRSLRLTRLRGSKLTLNIQKSKTDPPNPRTHRGATSIRTGLRPCPPVGCQSLCQLTAANAIVVRTDCGAMRGKGPMLGFRTRSFHFHAIRYIQWTFQVALPIRPRVPPLTSRTLSAGCELSLPKLRLFVDIFLHRIALAYVLAVQGTLAWARNT
jgi:hypothetical protein